MRKGTALIVGCAPGPAGALCDFFAEAEYDVAVAEDDSDAFRRSCTENFDVIVVDFSESGSASRNALTVESITMVNPSARIAAISPQGDNVSSDTKLAMSKTRHRIRLTGDRTELVQLLA